MRNATINFVMRNIAMGAAFVYGCWANSAAADWQYTKWGFSQAQVIDASKRVAVPTSEDDKKKHSLLGANDSALSALLSAPYESGSFQFTAYFYFDNQNKLALVSLDLTSGDPNALIGALRTKYGKPTSDEKSEVMESLDWYVGADMVAVMKIGSDATVSYRSRFDKNNQGL